MPTALLLNSGNCLTLLRQVLSDTNNSNQSRWTDSALLNFIDRGNKRIVRDTWFPDSRILQYTVANQQLYQFPLLLKVYRIYIAGQKIYDSDTDTLEGYQIGYGGAGPPGTAAPPLGTDAPPGTVGAGAPNWAIQEPLSYPSAGIGCGWSFPTPDAQPWPFNDSGGCIPPRFYWRGGYLGFVPTPANAGAEICVDAVRQPDTVVTNSQGMTSPENYLDAIVWAAASIAFMADDGNRAAENSQRCEGNYEREKRKLLEWRSEYPGQQRHGPKPSVLRPAYNRLRMVRNRGGCW